MASKSASLRKAQAPLSCHFCNEQAIQWKCEECDVFMCTSCKEKIHQRLKSAQDHEIVSVSDIWKDSPTRREVASESTRKRSISEGKMLKSSIRNVQTLEKHIFDIAVSREGEILFNKVGHNDVYLLTHTGEIKTVLETSPMRSLALHVNKDNELVIGFRDHGPIFPVKEFSVRQVIIFDSDYKRKITLENDTKGRKLFSYPARIKTDSKNVLYVADWMNEHHSGRIVAVDTNGRLKFTYNGKPDLKKEFVPNGMAITPSDNIILSDSKNNALHILNSRGELLGLQFVDKEYNIQNPNPLCIDSKGYLLIGRGLFQGSDANIYVAKIIEHFM